MIMVLLLCVVTGIVVADLVLIVLVSLMVMLLSTIVVSVAVIVHHVHMNMNIIHVKENHQVIIVPCVTQMVANVSKQL